VLSGPHAIGTAPEGSWVTFTESVPWFVPGLIVTVAISLAINGLVARALAMSRTIATAAIVSLGVIVSATLTPYSEAIESGATGSRSCDLSRVGLASLNELMAVSINDTLPNVVLFVPLGLAIGLVPRSRHKAVLVLAGVALPFAIETTQLLVPSLARACESADVFDNLTGLTIGLAAGWFLARVRS
jgi:glycopeptide antibiotics resistance protein